MEQHNVHTDITLGLPKILYLLHCPQCNCYWDPPKTWIKLPLQSIQLLLFCLGILKKNMASNNVRLVRAQRISTESNSRRIKIRVSVRKEVQKGDNMFQQSYVVDFVRLNRICESCTWLQDNPNQWNSLVQLRQHAFHMRSFFRLKEDIFKDGVADNAVRINKMEHGIDFFYSNKSCANKLLDFIKGRIPVRICCESNDYDKKCIFSVEDCPIRRQDLIFLPPKIASSLGNIGPIVICSKVTNVIDLFDPLTSTQCLLDGDMYWRAPFKSLLTRKELVEYAVLDVNEVYSEVTVDGKKFGLANAEVARVKDLGKNDTRFNIKTHLGYLLKTGDYALGYDLCEANCSDSEIELKEHIGGGGVILMKKIYEEKPHKRRVVQQLYLKDLEEITNEVLGISLGGEEPPLEEKLGGLNLSGEEYKEKKKARRMA